MEQRFSNESIDLVTLREFCEQEGEAVMYRKGDQLEREGDPARWLAYVTEGCFKYVTHGLSNDREHTSRSKIQEWNNEMLPEQMHITGAAIISGGL